MECPCKPCDIREVGCHATCISYMRWKKEQDDIRKKRQSAQNLHRLVNDGRGHHRYNPGMSLKECKG